MSPAEQTARLILWLASGVVMTSFLDLIWCAFQRVPARIRKKWLSWAMTAGIIIISIASVYMTFQWANGRWRVYDLVAQGTGGFLYFRQLQYPVRALGRVGDVVVLRPVWFILHLFVAIVRTIVRFHVRLVAVFYQMAYSLVRKIFPSTLQSRALFMYNIANRRTRRKRDARKSTSKST